VIIPLLGNVAENYVALRYAWAGDGDGAMSVIMHSVVQIALLMTGILVIASQFIGRHALSLQLDPVLTVSLGLALVVLWMIMYDGEMQPVEAVGLLAIYVILGAAVWAEGSLGT
jgi:calcium/proton exchanger cax